MRPTVRILHVEDCEISAEVLKRTLNRHCGQIELTLDVVTTVSEAIQVFDVQVHVAALIDWNLPDGDGTEVAHHIRSQSATLPIIFLSALFAEEHILTAREYSPKECLVKEPTSEFAFNIVRHLPIADTGNTST